MENTILAFSSLEIDPPPLLAALRVREGSDEEAEIRRMIAEMQSIARPMAIYRVAYIEGKGEDYLMADGVRLTSRVLRVNLDGIHRCFPFVVTSGREAESWANAFGGFLLRFWADAVNQALLHAAIKALEEHLRDRFAVASLSMMNPGSLTDWPLREQRALFSLLGDVGAAVGVELTQSLLMVPTKSVSGIFFPSAESRALGGEASFASCQLCPREICPNRRAPYDPELYDRRYRATQMVETVPGPRAVPRPRAVRDVSMTRDLGV